MSKLGWHQRGCFFSKLLGLFVNAAGHNFKFIFSQHEKDLEERMKQFDDADDGKVKWNYLKNKIKEALTTKAK